MKNSEGSEKMQNGQGKVREFGNSDSEETMLFKQSMS